MSRKQKKRTAKHLTLENRAVIESMLNQGEPVSQIARYLNRPISTISREIQRHKTIVPRKSNDCQHFHSCRRKHVCGDSDCKAYCRYCTRCVKTCLEYQPHQCALKTASPHVCNSCASKHMCKQEKHFYYAGAADSEYRSVLSDTRSGFSLTEAELNKLDETVSPLLRKGVSPYHILTTYRNLPVSESTLRRMIDKCVLQGRNIDLRNQVKRKPRKKPVHVSFKEYTSIDKQGHLYSDFLTFQEEHDLPLVEMDCVEGCQEDSAVLLTLHFVECHMQLAFIMNAHDSANVVATLDKIETTLGKELFAQLFPIILTDNGKEFMDIKGMERSIYGGSRTKVFFCEPNRSDQKGHCEKNHTHIRYVIPKGTSLEQYSQADISLMMDHINSYFRRSLHGKCPYDVAKQFFPEDFFMLLGLETIPPEDVFLKPALLKNRSSK